MSQLQPNDPAHVGRRNLLRRVGPIVFAVGLLLLIISGVDFFTAEGMPKLFWLGFVAMPLMFVGGVCSMYGFMGALFRYQLNEGMPVATDSMNYAAGETRGAMKTVAGAITEGVREGMQDGRIVCAKCGASNERDSKFCKACGGGLRASV